MAKERGEKTPGWVAVSTIVVFWLCSDVLARAVALEDAPRSHGLPAHWRPKLTSSRMLVRTFLMRA